MYITDFSIAHLSTVVLKQYFGQPASFTYKNQDFLSFMNMSPLPPLYAFLDCAIWNHPYVLRHKESITVIAWCLAA